MQVIVINRFVAHSLAQSIHLCLLLCQWRRHCMSRSGSSLGIGHRDGPSGVDELRAKPIGCQNLSYGHRCKAGPVRYEQVG